MAYYYLLFRMLEEMEKEEVLIKKWKCRQKRRLIHLKRLEAAKQKCLKLEKPSRKTTDYTENDSTNESSNGG